MRRDTEYPYSVRMRENVDQNNSEYGHFLRTEYFHDTHKDALVLNACKDGITSVGNHFFRFKPFIIFAKNSIKDVSRRS